MVVQEQPSINNIMGGLEGTGGVRLHNHRRKLKQRFDIIKKLGQGTYGKVQLGVNKETGQEVAIKTIKKCKIETEADLIRIRREIQIMSSLRHPYIIHIYEVFENKDKMVLVMEYAAGGELYDYLSERKVLEEAEARRIFRQIAMAVYYCHKHQICHRDLKLENILLDEDGNAKIADFGLSNVFDSKRLLSTFCGSPLYASPEIVKGIPYCGPEVDCWSLGVLLYTLVYGAMPFDGSNFKRLVRQISQGEYYEPKNPSGATGLVRGLLTVSGSDRLDITGVCEDPWLNQGEEMSCIKLAVSLSAQTPVRLDLLLALAPQEAQPTVSNEEAAAPIMEEASSDPRPLRSQSLGSLAPSQTVTITPIAPPQKRLPEESSTENIESGGARRKEKKPRERSSSRSRQSDDSKDEKSEKRKVKKTSVKKKSINKDTPEAAGGLEGESREEMERVAAEARKIVECLPEEPEAQVTAEVETPVVSKHSAEPQALIEEEAPPPTPPQPLSPEEEQSPPLPKSPPPVEQVREETPVKEPSTEPVPKQDPPRRKSKVFETAELFNKNQAEPKTPKKVFLPGVKVLDAKAAFERRSSLSGNSSSGGETTPTATGPAPKPAPSVPLASTVHLDRLVKSALSPADQERIKKEQAVKVIANAIQSQESGDKKASTLPRRKVSKPEAFKPTTPGTPDMIANTTVSQIVYPTPIPPVPAPRLSMSKQDSTSSVGSTGPREHIIPIMVEDRDRPIVPSSSTSSSVAAERPPMFDRAQSLVKQGSLASSKASSLASVGRQDSDSSSVSGGEPIRKSPREVIIPIAIEGGGFITPSATALSRISSVNESEDGDLTPMHGFGLHSTRRRPAQLETADSVSSDEEDQDFEILTAENLFSTLLSRVRSLTQRLNEESRPNFPRLFNHPSIFDSHPGLSGGLSGGLSRGVRGSSETRTFGPDPTPWRKKRSDSSSSTSSSSTLPRDFLSRSLRRLAPDDELRIPRRTSSVKMGGEKPPVGNLRRPRTISRTVSDSAGTDLSRPSYSRVPSRVDSSRFPVYSRPTITQEELDSLPEAYRRIPSVRNRAASLAREEMDYRNSLENEQELYRQRSSGQELDPIAESYRRPRLSSARSREHLPFDDVLEPYRRLVPSRSKDRLADYKLESLDNPEDMYYRKPYSLPSEERPPIRSRESALDSYRRQYSSPASSYSLSSASRENLYSDSYRRQPELMSYPESYEVSPSNQQQPEMLINEAPPKTLNDFNDSKSSDSESASMEVTTFSQPSSSLQSSLSKDVPVTKIPVGKLSSGSVNSAVVEPTEQKLKVADNSSSITEVQQDTVKEATPKKIVRKKSVKTVTKTKSASKLVEPEVKDSSVDEGPRKSPTKKIVKVKKATDENIKSDLGESAPLPPKPSLPKKSLTDAESKETPAPVPRIKREGSMSREIRAGSVSRDVRASSVSRELRTSPVSRDRRAGSEVRDVSKVGVRRSSFDRESSVPRDVKDLPKPLFRRPSLVRESSVPRNSKPGPDVKESTLANRKSERESSVSRDIQAVSDISKAAPKASAKTNDITPRNLEESTNPKSAEVIHSASPTKDISSNSVKNVSSNKVSSVSPTNDSAEKSSSVTSETTSPTPREQRAGSIVKQLASKVFKKFTSSSDDSGTDTKDQSPKKVVLKSVKRSSEPEKDIKKESPPKTTLKVSDTTNKGPEKSSPERQETTPICKDQKDVSVTNLKEGSELLKSKEIIEVSTGIISKDVGKNEACQEVLMTPSKAASSLSNVKSVSVESKIAQEMNTSKYEQTQVSVEASKGITKEISTEVKEAPQKLSVEVGVEEAPKRPIRRRLSASIEVTILGEDNKAGETSATSQSDSSKLDESPAEKKVKPKIKKIVTRKSDTSFSSSSDVSKSLDTVSEAKPVKTIRKKSIKKKIEGGLSVQGEDKIRLPTVTKKSSGTDQSSADEKVQELSVKLPSESKSVSENKSDVADSIKKVEDASSNGSKTISDNKAIPESLPSSTLPPQPVVNPEATSLPPKPSSPTGANKTLKQDLIDTSASTSSSTDNNQVIKGIEEKEDHSRNLVPQKVEVEERDINVLPKVPLPNPTAQLSPRSVHRLQPVSSFEPHQFPPGSPILNRQSNTSPNSGNFMGSNVFTNGVDGSSANSNSGYISTNGERTVPSYLAPDEPSTSKAGTQPSKPRELYISEQDVARTDEEKLDDFLLRGKLSSLERVKQYLEDLNKNLEGDKGNSTVRADEYKSKYGSRSPGSVYEQISNKYARPRTMYTADTTETSDFDRYLAYKRGYSDTPFGTISRRNSAKGSYERFLRTPGSRAGSVDPEPKEEKSYARSVSVPDPPPSPGKSILEKYLSAYTEQTKTEPKEAKDTGETEQDTKLSRIDKTIRALRRNSIGQSNEITESSLLKRAVSMETVGTPVGGRRLRASSLKPNEAEGERPVVKRRSLKARRVSTQSEVEDPVPPTSENGVEPSTSNGDSRQSKLANLKRLDLSTTNTDTSLDPSPVGDWDEEATSLDNSDTWSGGSELLERQDSGEDCVSERIRRKSFYMRFNTPVRSASRSSKKKFI